MYFEDAVESAASTPPNANIADVFMEKAGRIIFCAYIETFFNVFQSGELGNMRGLFSKGNPGLT